MQGLDIHRKVAMGPIPQYSIMALHNYRWNELDAYIHFHVNILVSTNAFCYQHNKLTLDIIIFSIITYFMARTF